MNVTLIQKNKKNTAISLSKRFKACNTVSWQTFQVPLAKLGRDCRSLAIQDRTKLTSLRIVSHACLNPLKYRIFQLPFSLFVCSIFESLLQIQAIFPCLHSLVSWNPCFNPVGKIGKKEGKNKRRKETSFWFTASRFSMLCGWGFDLSVVWFGLSEERERKVKSSSFSFYFFCFKISGTWVQQ